MSTQKPTSALLPFALALGLGLAALPLSAQSHPNRTKGFDPRGTYSISDVDSINLFNGALTVTIPIGPRYPVGSSDYGFALVYNSNAWTVREVCDPEGSFGPVSFSSSLRTSCRTVVQEDGTSKIVCNTVGFAAWNSPGDDYNPRPATGCYNLAYPNPSTNAGLGWQLNLGKIVEGPTAGDDRSRFVAEGASWTYVGGDGAQHALQSSIDGAFYSHDGSFLRMKVPTVCPTEGLPCREVDFPEGSSEIHELHGAGLEAEWRLKTRSDAYGQGFKITYFSGLSWEIEDTAERKHQVTLVQPSTAFPAAITSMLLHSNGPRPLEVDFVLDPETIDRAAPHNDDGTEEAPISPQIDAQFLESIDFKSAGTLLSQWTFGPARVGYAVDEPLTARIHGVLKRLKMPTGATVAWAFGGGYRYPSGASGRGHLRSSPGVRSRTVTDVTGASIGTWSYAPNLEVRPADEECQYGNNIPWLSKCHEKEFTNTVTDPDDYRTKHYFSVYPLPPFFEDDEHWDGSDYGLPFTRKETTPITLANEALLLSTETFAPFAPDTAPIRRSYVQYSRDAIQSPFEWDGFHSETLNNERVSARAEVFLDDPAAGDSHHWRLTQYENWDGTSHYKDEIIQSSFPGEANRSRKVTTDYTGVRPGVAELWFLGKFKKVVTQDSGGGSSSGLTHQVREVCFDTSKPFIERIRTLEGASAGPNDVLAAFTRNALGQVTEERLYGGDGAGLGTETLCNVSLTGETPTSKVQHTYTSGVRSRSVVLDPCSNTPIVTLLDQTIEPTGLPTTVRDATGIGVTLTYDFLGRRTEETPDAGHGARTVYEYRIPGIENLPGSTPAIHPANQEAQVIVKRLSGGGAQLAVSEVYFDGLGRPIADSTWMPKASGGTGVALSWSKLTAQGWKDRVSTPRCGGPATDLTAACGASGTSSTEPGLEALPPLVDYPQDHQGVTRFELYDPFGRPGRIVAPDGFLSTATYTGVREVSRTVRVAAGTGGALTNATRTERYDSLGRMIEVTEPSGPNGANVTTTYGYDVGDRLVSVSTTSAGETQTRGFDYDGRGFLRSETHPELGESGNGTKQYSLCDARGLAGNSTVLLADGYPDGDRALDFRYDPAGRLIEVKNGGIPLEQYFYGWENGPAGFTAGKIVGARRYNTGSGVTVSETYEYQGVGGRVSKKTTSTSLGHRFEIAATYNQLGDMASTTYPTCSGLAGCETVDDDRTVSYGYQLGYLMTVGETTSQGSNATAWLTGAEYAPNGRWRQLTRANGTVDEQVGDPKGLGRPRSISVGKDGSTLWTTGLYAFDGAGNITAMGPEIFTYDKVSRLKSGTVKKLPLATVTAASETLSYDAFGNQITRSVTGTPSTPTPPVNPETNRLSLGTYDVSGNLRRFEEIGLLVTHNFDALNSLTSTTQNGQTTHYLYAPDGERLATLRPGGVTTWTLRGISNEVLRVFEQDAADTWRRQRDYIYRGGQLLASTAPEPEGVNHYHLDHLGSTRLVTNQTGQQTAFHAYLPFGEEVTAPAASATKLKYTGHEREEGMDPVSRADDMDYMHARWCSPAAGRFLSVDPVLGRVLSPQSWNRYAYVRGNPVISIDPDGEDQWVLIWGPSHDGIGHAAIGIQDRGSDGNPTGNVTFRHLWPANPVGKSQQEPADYRVETVPEAQVTTFLGGEGRVADGIIKIAGDNQRDKNVVAVLVAGEKNKQYIAPSNTCSTYCAIGVVAAGIPVTQTGRVAFTVGGIEVKSQSGVTTPVAVYNSIVASKDPRVQVLKPLNSTDPNLTIEF